jgi:RimJ/RimL family protein N-acetyltransferase
MATDALFRTTEVFQVDAHVKADNAASMRLFAGAGYVEHRVEMIRNQQAFHFILKKPATAIDALEVDSLPVLVAGH